MATKSIKESSRIDKKNRSRNRRPCFRRVSHRHITAFVYEVQAQMGKHITTTCHDPSGRSFNAAQLLLDDLQALQATFGGQLKPNPIMGFVSSAANTPIYGATVNLMGSAKTVAASATTDSTGFYYFADTSGLAGGVGYSASVTLPKGFKSSTPGTQTFTWLGSSVVGNFVLY